MKPPNISRSFLAGLLALGAIAAFSAASAAEPKPLAKNQAVQLITSMGYQDVEVGAIVHGFAVGSDSHSVATAFGIGRRNGLTEKLQVILFYDVDTGWFGYEYDTPPTKLRTWTLAGYKEFRPKMSLSDAEATELILGSWKPDEVDELLTYTKDGKWTQAIKGAVNHGTWKIEGSAIISTESKAPETNHRFEILGLDKSALILKLEKKDAAAFSVTFHRSGDK